jgi:hypothetical protein
VFLGALSDIPFRRKRELKAEAHDLDWSTSPLSEEQVLAMRNEDLLLAMRRVQRRRTWMPRRMQRWRTLKLRRTQR